MQSMPNILSRSVKTFVGDPAHTSNMAAAKMGYGPGRPITTIPRRKQICSSSSRIFYKMDRGKAAGKDNLRNCQKILLAKHHLQIRCTEDSDSRQWKAVRFRELQRILQKHWNKISLRLSIPPRVQWCCGKSKRSNFFSSIKNTAGSPQRKMGR